MSSVFTQALQGPVDPYQLALQQLQQQPQPQQPMFTPEEQRARIAGNNQQANLAMLGMLSGDDSMQGVGGSIFKQALANRQERITNRGVVDPLTGETAIDPAYREQQEETRRGKVLDAALRFQDSREKAQERAEQNKQRAEDRADLVRLTASLRPGKAGPDPELSDLKKDLIRAQIEAANSRVAVAEGKAQSAAEKKQMQLTQFAERARTTIGDLQRVHDRVDISTAGIVGSQFKKIPGSPAYDLARDVDTIKANIGFQELQAMRQASPTGGALGQVAVKELDMLQAVLGSLDTAQSPGQLKQNLKKVQGHYQNWLHIMQQAGGEVAQPSGAPSGPTPAPAPVSTPTPPAADPAAGSASAPAPRRRRFNADGTLVP